MVPEAWQKDKLMPYDKKLFYQWSSCVMEPWDGPGMSLVLSSTIVDLLFLQVIPLRF